MVKIQWKTKTYKRTSGCGNLYITIDETEDGRPIHVFIENINGCKAMTNTLARYISNDLEAGTKDLSKIIHILKKATCASCITEGEGKSCAHIVAKILEEYDNKEKVLDSPF